MRPTYDPHSLWVLSGAVVRISQRLGLHRDGATHKIPPFDAEIRRRTWWQVVFLDGYASKISGAGFPAWLANFDTKVPLNISDSDLSPGMTDLPTAKEGATEMIFCGIRYEVARSLRRQMSGRGVYDGQWHMATSIPSLQDRDKLIDELEAQFQEQFIAYCDP